jgi:hypothetical protein
VLNHEIVGSKLLQPTSSTDIDENESTGHSSQRKYIYTVCNCFTYVWKPLHVITGGGRTFKTRICPPRPNGIPVGPESLVRSLYPGLLIATSIAKEDQMLLSQFLSKKNIGTNPRDSSFILSIARERFCLPILFLLAVIV